MKLRPILLAMIAAAAVLFAALPASAQQAQATTSVNVRSGPGTGYRVVDVLRAGENVEIIRCTGGWCNIDQNGPDGWVSASYLRIYDARPGRPSGNNPDIGFCIDAPNFSIGVNCDNDDRRPGVPGRPGFPSRAGEICFYEDFNYRGASFCARPGQADRSLSSRWNDRISSIRVRGNASAVVCQNFNFGGRCARVENSVSRLGPRENDTISSYRVDR